ncbi:glutathione S-transferase N-terminal domain-containing protein [Bradyrhizobium sp. CCBAU 51753]|uniref:glutathione S-transferase N-terminal domain-containing protein n=1 Tax=Bradyrhizobium sp. CCBAU 51753 TaxID=1325100 RepID=UPI00188CBE47|nr:glutathione S-transferase N-terminal domain-containing protein [Bradyrhizobium sp. CCBAU 51753]
MKLIGTYLSPYARRVAAALISRGLPFEHEAVNGYREFEIASRYNPVAKVPSLVLDDGEILIDSTAILDYLNELTPSAPLIPAGSRARRTTLKLAAIGYGVYEQAANLSFRGRDVAATEAGRWKAQILGGLRALDEAARDGGPLRATPLDAAAITAIVAVEYLARTNPDLETLPAIPALAELVAEYRDAPPFALTRAAA